MTDWTAMDQVMAWLSATVEWRLRQFFSDEDCAAPPDWPEAACRRIFADLIAPEDPDRDMSLILALAAAPHVAPERLDGFCVRNRTLDRRFSEVGGSEVQGQFIPTLQTALFLVAGLDMAARGGALARLRPDAPLSRRAVLARDPEHSGPSDLMHPHILSDEAAALLLTGIAQPPRLSSRFPAERLQTSLGWDDLVLPAATRHRVDEILAWVRHRPTLLQDWNLSGRIKPGFAALFHGPPGTGKTLTASLLGKGSGLPVFRVDLSLISSKWVGETEKSIAALFDRAQSNDWILFFDEADALFGKRTDVRSGNDRFQNQQVALLLQRIESFDGITILASNLKGNIDKAFARRFQSIIHFDVPGPGERLRLWQGAFGAPVPLCPEVDLNGFAAAFELTGAAITNVLRHASLTALSKGQQRIGADDIHEGITRELQKEGRFV